MTLLTQPEAYLLLFFPQITVSHAAPKTMRLLLGYVYMLLTFSSDYEASGSPNMMEKDSAAYGCSEVKMKPVGQCGNEDNCSYQIAFPPLTIQLPKQFQLLEKTMKELESLKKMVRELRSACLGCSLQGDSGEKNSEDKRDGETRAPINDSLNDAIQEMQVKMTNMSKSLKNARKQINDLQEQLDTQNHLNMKEVEQIVDKQLGNITGVITKLNGICSTNCSSDLNPADIMAFRDCSDYSAMGTKKSGIFTIQPSLRNRTFKVFCDMESNGGGWTVVQQRMNGSVNFNRTWADYKTGFGNMHGEFWLGNDRIHLLSSSKDMILRIELEDLDGVREFAKYDQFYVANEFLKYRLSLNGYSGTAGNALNMNKDYNHDHMFFTTWDRDNDLYQPGNCGVYYGSGWWFNACMSANLNGKYYHKKYTGKRDGIFWSTWPNISKENYPTNFRQAFKSVKVMIRPKNFNP